MQKVFLHLDMNSYFASVEQQDHLAWRGRPVGVCEHLGGIIIGASIEAKRWGITTGTPVWEARKIFPKIILSPTSPERYRHYTRRFIKLVSDYTDRVEVYSIDEVFLDITRMCNVRIPNPGMGMPGKSKNSEPEFSIPPLVEADPFEEGVGIAREIKKRMKAEVGDYLTCSIGIAENKLQAKIASDLKKPDGLTVIAGDQNIKRKMQDKGVFSFAKEELYDRLKLTDVPGVGRKMEKRLGELGIKNLKDLRNYPKSWLVGNFGILGHHLHELGQLKGGFAPEAENNGNIKSVGHMYTLPPEFRQQKFFVPVLYKLSEMVGKRLRNQGLGGEVIHFHIRYEKGQWWGKSRKLAEAVWDGREIFLQAMRILREEFGGKGQKFSGTRLIGISLAGLRAAANQLSLFGAAERQKRLAEALDKLNDKYGDFTVCRAPVISAKKVFHDSVGFGRIKEL